MRPDVDAGKNRCIGSNVCAVANDYRFDAEPCLDDGNADRVTRVSGAQHLCSRSPTNVVFDNQVPRIEIGVGSDPDMAADLASSIKASLNHCLRPDKDRVTEFHSFRMLDNSLGTHLKIV